MDTINYEAALNKLTGFTWQKLHPERVYNGRRRCLVTPCDLHQNRLPKHYFAPLDIPPMMNPHQFYEEILMAKNPMSLQGMAAIYQFANRAELISIDLPPKLIGNVLIKSKLSLDAQVKVSRSKYYALRETVLPHQTRMFQHQTDQALQDWLGSITIGGYHEAKNGKPSAVGLELGVGIETTSWSTELAITDIKPPVYDFEATFEPKGGYTIERGDWELVVNGVLMLEGTATLLEEPPSKPIEEDDFKRIAVGAGIVLGTIAVAIIIRFAPSLIGRLLPLAPIAMREGFKYAK